MKDIDIIRQQLLSGAFDFSRHGFKRAIERNISDAEISEAGYNAVIIEEYPDDKYAPSCLVLGFSSKGRPLHMQVSLSESDLLRIITIYEPDEKQWIDSIKRR